MKLPLLSIVLLFAVAAHAKDPAPAKPAEPVPAPPAKNDTPAAKADALPFKFIVAEHTATSVTESVKSGNSEVKSINTITDKTIVENAGAPAKFADIKVGDTVSGTRMKTGENTYEIIKITSFARLPKPPRNVRLL